MTTIEQTIEQIKNSLWDGHNTPVFHSPAHSLELSESFSTVAGLRAQILSVPGPVGLIYVAKPDGSIVSYPVANPTYAVSQQ